MRALVKIMEYYGVIMSLYYEYGEKELAYLWGKDKKLGAIIDRVGIIKREVNPDLFSSLVESIVSQQVSSKAADSICARLNELSGMDATRLHNLSVEELNLTHGGINLV